VLFLGDNGHHRPASGEAINPVMAGRGIDVTYTTKSPI